jgi:phytoene dehydrogenase-like protein
MSRVHVIGAGLAGLSASVRLVQAGREVHLYEAAPLAGGRCRSYFEPKLDCTIDNGGHVILGANAATLAYVETAGARGELLEIAPARFPFIDLTSGVRWTLRPRPATMSILPACSPRARPTPSATWLERTRACTAR